MGKASRIFKSERRLGLYLLAALCVALGAIFVGLSVLETQSEPVKSAATPEVASSPETLSNDARVESQARIEGQAARRAAEEKAARAEAAQQEAAREQAAAAQAAAPERPAPERPAPERAVAEPEPAAHVAPADTTMSLSVPALGISG
ncbi:MAG TPA: hypothetical protein VHM69_17985, partial [Rubrobacter sp.]|nr:hypothetical protein [Rubrobacter sp.]